MSIASFPPVAASSGGAGGPSGFIIQTGVQFLTVAFEPGNYKFTAWALDNGINTTGELSLLDNTTDANLLLVTSFKGYDAGTAIEPIEAFGTISAEAQVLKVEFSRAVFMQAEYSPSQTNYATLIALNSTQSVTIASDNTPAVIIGAGGGGGGSSSGINRGGGGGGSGYIDTGTIAAGTYTFTAGAGGTGGSGGDNVGATGGTSSFSTLSATSGLGGSGSNTGDAAGGNGGSGGGTGWGAGAINTIGSGGSNGADGEGDFPGTGSDTEAPALGTPPSVGGTIRAGGAFYGGGGGGQIGSGQVNGGVGSFGGGGGGGTTGGGNSGTTVGGAGGVGALFYLELA